MVAANTRQGSAVLVSLHSILIDLTPPAQLRGFFAAQAQEIKKAIGALDMFHHVPNIRATREKRVDDINQLPLIGEDSLHRLGPGVAAGAPRADSHEITAALVLVTSHAQKLYQVSASRIDAKRGLHDFFHCNSRTRRRD